LSHVCMWLHKEALLCLIVCVFGGQFCFFFPPFRLHLGPRSFIPTLIVMEAFVLIFSKSNGVLLLPSLRFDFILLINADNMLICYSSRFYLPVACPSKVCRLSSVLGWMENGRVWSHILCSNSLRIQWHSHRSLPNLALLIMFIAKSLCLPLIFYPFALPVCCLQKFSTKS